MTHCLHCRAVTSNGLALCDLCQRRAADALASLPVYHRNLARWRPGRAGSRPVPGSRVLWTGEHRNEEPDRIARAVALIENDVTTWLRQLEDDRNIVIADAAEFDAWCTLLAQHLTSIATLDWCGDMMRDLIRHERRLRGLTEASIPGWYAGACRTKVTMEGDQCGTPTYVVPGLTWTTCPGCDRTTAARDHLDAVLDEARDWVARPKALAEAVVALVDGQDSVDRLLERIKKWAQRGKIPAFRKVDEDGDEVGPKRYRLGDVLDLVLTRDAANTERIGA